MAVYKICGYGGIGRRAGFRFQWETVQVQVLLSAAKRYLEELNDSSRYFFCISHYAECYVAVLIVDIKNYSDNSFWLGFFFSVKAYLFTYYVMKCYTKVVTGVSTLSEQRCTRSVKNQFHPLLRYFHSVYVQYTSIKRLAGIEIAFFPTP